MARGLAVNRDYADTAVPPELRIEMSAKRFILPVLPLLLMGAALIDSAPASSDDITTVVAAVGDVACDPSNRNWHDGDGTALGCAQKRVSEEVLNDVSVQTVLGLGDYQYDCGDPADYAVSYAPTWGRLDGLMNPVAGNHEYKTGNDVYGQPCPATNATAAGAFQFFGASHPETQGHFSFDLGTWHIVGLNGNCAKVGGCGVRSAQTKWLTADLNATTQPCVLAYWHQPRFTGLGKQGGRIKAYLPWWDALYAHHADVVLNGHIHNYQRYPALDPTGATDPLNGLTEYVVGTGGEALAGHSWAVTPQPAAYDHAFGCLRMNCCTRRMDGRVHQRLRTGPRHLCGHLPHLTRDPSGAGQPDGQRSSHVRPENAQFSHSISRWPVTARASGSVATSLVGPTARRTRCPPDPQAPPRPPILGRRRRDAHRAR